MASPPHPCKVLGFHPKPHKFFEKNLTKNFYLSPPNLSAGFPVSGPQQAPPPQSGVRVMSCAATRRDLRAQALGAGFWASGSQKTPPPLASFAT